MPSYFGITTSTLDQETIKKMALEKLNCNENYCVCTLNPEILLKAKKNSSYAKILDKFDLKLIDGFGIVLVSWLKGFSSGSRFSGADFADFVLSYGLKNNLNMAFVINKFGWSREENFAKSFPGNNPKMIYMEQKDNPLEIVNRLSETEILFVGLGAPFQEEFIQKIKLYLPYLRLAIGVGGTFDYWTGAKKRAPKLLSKIGFEWAWRLIIQPNRFFRIINATLIFLFFGLFSKDINAN